MLSTGAVRFFFACPFFLVLTTLIVSTGTSSGTSYSGNDVNRADAAGIPVGKAGIERELEES